MSPRQPAAVVADLARLSMTASRRLHLAQDLGTTGTPCAAGAAA
ncbi:hypothetical protein [Paracoccus mutanolyticus]|nr:hypothetical protein [Paracoccus mutanolyticus]